MNSFSSLLFFIIVYLLSWMNSSAVEISIIGEHDLIDITNQKE